MMHQQIPVRLRCQSNGIRKGTVRSRPRTRWTTDMDEIDFAHTTLNAPTRGNVARDGSSDLRSVANVQKLSMLQEIFPTVPVEIIEDVLVAAQFRMDFAASMLGELSRELTATDDAAERADLVLVDWASVRSEHDADHWHEVSESRPELQQWVMVQDDWEVINDVSSQEKARSYADALRSSAGGPIKTVASLSPTSSATTLAPLVRLKKDSPDDEIDDFEDFGSKSLGSRKRRYLRKYRS